MVLEDKVLSKAIFWIATLKSTKLMKGTLELEFKRAERSLRGLIKTNKSKQKYNTTTGTIDLIY